VTTTPLPFADRADAGRRLAGALKGHVDVDAVVLGLPRGGVPVAFEVARTLAAPLDVILVRKVGAPFQPELAMGAVGEDGVRVLDHDVLRILGLDEAAYEAVEDHEREELARRGLRFRAVRERVDLSGRVAILVDDGIATGSTASAALQVARAHGAARCILAVPVAPLPALAKVRDVADEVVCLAAPDPFFAVGQWYRDFSAIDDHDVVRLLRGSTRGTADAPD
jgi:putative phosphoribosyl transferase